MEGEIVYAIHNFEASVEDEISLEAGEAILVIEKDDLYNDGWWQGKNSKGEVGLFPMNFISSVNPKAPNNVPCRYANLMSDNPRDEDRNPMGSQPSNTLGGRLSDPMVQKVSYDPNDSPPSESVTSDDVSEVASDTKGMVHEEGYSAITPAMSSSDSDSVLPPDNIDSTPPTKSAKDSPAEQGRTPSTPNRSSFRQSVRLSINSVAGLPHPTLWNNDQVVEWLKQVGFESVSGLFKDNEITGDILLKLDLNSLKDIGILAFGKRFNLNNAINSLKNKYDLQSPAKKDAESSSSDDPPPPSTEAKPPVDHVLYPLDARQSGQLAQKVQALALGDSVSPHNHVQQWLQDASEYDFEHDLLKNGIVSSPAETRSRTSIGTNPDAGYDPPVPTAFKKQVSFSKDMPEVIGVSEAANAFDEKDLLRMRANQKALPPPPMPSQRMDLFPTSDNPITRTFSVDPVSVEDIMAGTYPPVSGYLKKQEGAIKLWKQRWCELEGSSLRVWDSPKRKKLKVALDLRGYKPVLDPSLNPGKYCFKLVHPIHKAHGFSSDESNDIRLWMKALMKVSIDRDVSAPVVTSCTVNTVPLHVARKLAPRPPSTMLTGNRENNDISAPQSGNSNFI
ncbi:hypothetical protein DSO57_1006285 [Entomophthora muscae]|uniref:Uncharacterized protein n=1 Tax=Entomophthora muscae TaxID=34485 RepID=A0ACC2SL35_9FUNG|nr:hypothetical protein DSO57_1006285 [Entomophthora muscae]